MSAAVHTPVKKSRLSLKFFQKKDTKRTLEFSESQVEEQKPSEREEPESCDQVVPTPGSCVPLVCDKRDGVVPFVGLNNLGNTCYLNSILQVLYYCPGFKDAIKKLRDLSKKTEKQKKDTENEEVHEEVLPMNIELLWSLHHLITSMEQLQSSFLLNPKKYIDSELATSPRRLLNTLRLLNPMYEGYLQHDAQEVLRCILGYIQEACESIEKEQKIEELPEKQAQDVDCGERKDEREQNSSLNESAEESSDKEPTTKEPQLDESSKDQSVSKRKSDTEAGNAKKRSKCLKPQSRRTSTAAEEAGHFTRSKRKSSGEVSAESDQNENKETSHVLAKVDGASTVPAKRPKQSKLSWLKPSGKQPSIFSKFRSMGKISTHAGGKDTKAKHEEGGDSLSSGKDEEAAGICSEEKCPVDSEEKSPSQAEEHRSLNLMERMFQGQLVLRTRCLECECYTERREDFQDISVPVQEIEFCRVDPDLEVSPDPKQESKTLKWAISQFASVERIVGEDKYFCETCHHYTEAERSLLFDKTPEVVTIHLKCFAASGSGLDPYAGLSKVSTPLHTPLKLSLEEWCTRPSKEHYELFAVVMHSGVTISSGHYTTYVKMVNLKDVKVELVDDSLKPESPGTAAAEAYNPARGYNDGEVSVGAASKAGAKKVPEGVGLLGGQRSVSGFELGGGKQANPDKGIKEECSSSQGHQTTVRNKSEREPIAVASAGKERDDAPVDDGDDLALCNLLDYEGKWMLFDDSEVRLFEEKDFLNACSPETCTTSIPYLLFYKKVLE